MLVGFGGDTVAGRPAFMLFAEESLPVEVLVPVPGKRNPCRLPVDWQPVTKRQIAMQRVANRVVIFIASIFKDW